MSGSVATTDKVPASAKAASGIACFLRAISFIATKVAVAGVPPFTLVTLRLLISSLCFFIRFIVRGSKPKHEGLTWLGQMFLLSLFGTGLHYSVQTIGQGYNRIQCIPLCSHRPDYNPYYCGAIPW